MAGDEFYLHVYNENKELLEEFYLGQFRHDCYNFSLNEFIYSSCDDQIFKQEVRESRNTVRYNVWDDKIIDEIKKYVENDYPPINEEEK